MSITEDHNLNGSRGTLFDNFFKKCSGLSLLIAIKI